MNIPSSIERGEVRSIPNLHPSQRSPSMAVASNHDAHYGGDTASMETPMSESFSDKIGSFVGSCSRTSLMYMAENVIVSNPTDHSGDNNDDHGSILSDHDIRSRRRNSLGTLNDERTSLLGYQRLDKVYTGQSHISTVADTYQDTDHHHEQHHHHHSHVKSTFMQSVFNSLNILIGVGILSLPLGMKYAGWILGMTIFFFCLALTNFTAKLLGRCLQAHPESQTYGDMAYNAYGNRGRIVISAIFLTELITCSVALVVLLSDGLDSLFPGSHPLLMRIASFFILTPMLFLPVRHLSYTSLIGIMSATCIILVILADGFSKSTRPGSLIEAADTTWWPGDWMAFPRCAGLIMSIFSGHAALPTIYLDMQHPKQFTKMVNSTYAIAAMIYLSVAVAGYRMFGSSTMQEITQNLVTIPEYNETLNRLAVWLIALNPIAKYGLTLNPVNLSWELALIRQPSIEAWCNKHPWRFRVIDIVGKILVSSLVVLLAYLIPEFDRIMSLLGAFFSFLISGMFPILCYLKIFGPSILASEKLILYTFFAISSLMAFTGTLWSFI